MSNWTKAWLLWIGSFFGIEFAALWADNHGGNGATLSEHFRKWFDTEDVHGRQIWLAAFGIFSAWFTCHIAVQGSDVHSVIRFGKDD